MKIIKIVCGIFLLVLYLITLPLLDAYRLAHAEKPELSNAVFYVQ